MVVPLSRSNSISKRTASIDIIQEDPDGEISLPRRPSISFADRLVKYVGQIV